VTIKRRRKAGNPYHTNRNENGRFVPTPRSLTLRDKISRKYSHRAYAALSAKEHQQLKELSLTLDVAMSDILAYLITNHLDQLAHQASFEAGQQSALQQSADNPPKNPTL
jgi:hypothetical protein